MNRPIQFRVWDRTEKKMSLVARIHYADDGYPKTISIEPAPKDNQNGYTIPNSVSCCPFCNYAKGDYSSEFFLNKIKEIYSFNYGQST